MTGHQNVVTEHQTNEYTSAVPILKTGEAKKKCTPYSNLKQILYPDQHKMTRSQCPVQEKFHAVAGLCGVCCATSVVPVCCALSVVPRMLCHVCCALSVVPCLLCPGCALVVPCLLCLSVVPCLFSHSVVRCLLCLSVVPCLFSHSVVRCLLCLSLVICCQQALSVVQ
jgi:hypothetical protein